MPHCCEMEDAASRNIKTSPKSAEEEDACCRCNLVSGVAVEKQEDVHIKGS